MTHSKDINEDISTFPEWDIHVGLNVRVWKRWHDQWMGIARSGRVPVYFFRFEDLLANSSKELEDIFAFVLGVESIKGTFIEHRI